VNDHKDAFQITLAMTLAVISHMTLDDWTKVVVITCAVGNLAISFLRWRFPK
jgi:hypothetical protein